MDEHIIEFPDGGKAIVIPGKKVFVYAGLKKQGICEHCDDPCKIKVWLDWPEVEKLHKTLDSLEVQP